MGRAPRWLNRSFYSVAAYSSRSARAPAITFAHQTIVLPVIRFLRRLVPGLRIDARQINPVAGLLGKHL